MALSDLTADSVRKAIDEFDRVGSPFFLEKYGFGPARSFFLEVDERHYDSKAIAGAAHGYLGPGYDPLRSSDFSGGEQTVATRLRELGFDVIRMSGGPHPDLSAEGATRNPKWLRDELILALDLYMTNPASPPGKASREVVHLSSLLNQLNRTLARSGGGDFRNPAGVYMKVMNFRRFDPEVLAAGHVGLTHGSKDEGAIWSEFSDDLPRLRIVAAAICAALALPPGEPGPLIDDEMVDAEEGRLLTALHVRRERSKKLVEARKKKALRSSGELRCECCDLNFAERYGDRGDGYIEVHHIRPVFTLVEGSRSHVDDLALVCSNCHRMIHRTSPWLSVEQLRALIRSAATSSGMSSR